MHQLGRKRPVVRNARRGSAVETARKRRRRLRTTEAQRHRENAQTGNSDCTFSLCLCGSQRFYDDDRTYLLNQSIVRVHAWSAAALSYRGVVSLLKPCMVPA